MVTEVHTEICITVNNLIYNYIQNFWFLPELRDENRAIFQDIFALKQEKIRAIKLRDQTKTTDMYEQKISDSTATKLRATNPLRTYLFGNCDQFTIFEPPNEMVREEAAIHSPNRLRSNHFV